MKTAIIAAALRTSSLAVFASEVAQCTPSSLTRSQVQAELMEAIRSGDIILPGEIGLTRRELYAQMGCARYAGESLRAV